MSMRRRVVLGRLTSRTPVAAAGGPKSGGRFPESFRRDQAQLLLVPPALTVLLATLRIGRLPTMGEARTKDPFQVLRGVARGVHSLSIQDKAFVAVPIKDCG